MAIGDITPIIINDGYYYHIRVVDSNGNGISGADVEWNFNPASYGLHAISTDAYGYCTAQADSSYIGTVTVSVSYSGYSNSPFNDAGVFATTSSDPTDGNYTTINLGSKSITYNVWSSSGTINTGITYNIQGSGTTSLNAYTSLVLTSGYTYTFELEAWSENNYDGVLLCSSPCTATSGQLSSFTTSSPYYLLESRSYATGTENSQNLRTVTVTGTGQTVYIVYHRDGSGTANGDKGQVTVTRLASIVNDATFVKMGFTIFAYTYNGSLKSAPISYSNAIYYSGTRASTEAGTYTVTFMPVAGHAWSDTGTSEKRSIDWEIFKADITYTVSNGSTTYPTIAFGRVTPSIDCTIYYGSSSSSMTYSITGKAGVGNTVILRETGGTSTVYAYCDAGSNYSVTDTFTVSATVAKATPPTVTLSAGTKTTYDGNTVYATAKLSSSLAGKFYYGSSSGATTYSVDANGTTAVSLTSMGRKDVGSTTIYVFFRPTDTTNYNDSSVSSTTASVTNKASQTVSFSPSNISCTFADGYQGGTITAASGQGTITYTLNSVTKSGGTTTTDGYGISGNIFYGNKWKLPQDGITNKTFSNGLSSYTQTHCQCTLTDTGYRIYRTPNQNYNSGSNSVMWGGFVVDNTDNRFNLQKGHRYVIMFDIKGISDNAANDVGWSNLVGWGGGGLYPGPTVNVSENPVCTGFNSSGWKRFYYDFTINDDVYKVCTTSYSHFVAGNTYISYKGFKFGWGYTDTGSNGTDVYINNIKLIDITCASVGTYTVSVTATAAGNSNYNSASSTKTFTYTVGKSNQPSTATPTVTGGSWTYDAKSHSASASSWGGRGTLTWTNQSRTSVGSQTASAYWSGDTNYNASGTGSATVKITAPDVSVTFNKNGGSGGTDSTTITYGTTVGNYPSITLPTRSKYTFAGYYDASSGGTQYYNSSGNSVRTWDKYTSTTLYAHWTEKYATAPTISSPTPRAYNGSSLSVVTSGGSGGTVKYRTSTDNSTWGSWSTTVPSRTNAGTTYVQAYTAGDSDHFDSGITSSVSIVISKASGSVTTKPTAKTLTYGTASAVANAGSGTGTLYYYKLTTTTTTPTAGTSGDWSTTIPSTTTTTSAGSSYRLYYYCKGDSNHNDTSVTYISITVNKKTITITAPTGKTSTYTGSALNLANAGSCSPNGSIQYCLTSGGTYSTTIPTATNVTTGTTVYWKAVLSDTTNYALPTTNSGSVTGVINKASSSAPTFSPTAKSGNYARPSTSDTNTVTITSASGGTGTISYTLNSVKLSGSSTDIKGQGWSLSGTTLTYPRSSTYGKPGSYTISVIASTAGDGNHTGNSTTSSFTLTISDWLVGINLVLGSSSINYNSTTTATVSATYAYAGTSDVTSSATITSSNTSVATIS